MGQKAALASILIIDDSGEHRAQIRRTLEASELFEEILEADDGLRGLKSMLNEDIDIVLCDLEMPGLDGEKLLRVKQQSLEGLPFLFLTGSPDRDRRARLLEAGASDVLTKPFHPPELVARLRLHLRTKRLHDELRVKNETLAKLSTTDPVTGLRTRRYLQEALSVEFLRARRYGTALAVMMADLDHFKQVNDTYGHPAGDAVLHGVAGVLQGLLRATDVGGRYGGEEYIVILAGNDGEGAVMAAERWREAIEASVFKSPDGRSIEITVSIGVASFHPDLESVDALVGAADAALYEAKEAGRNRVVHAAGSAAPAGTQSAPH